MKPIFRLKLLLLVCCALCFSISFADKHADTDPAIFWDKAGNIHIFASSEAELYFAWGWAQMRDNTTLLLDTIHTIQSERTSTSEQLDESQIVNYQFFAEGMNGFLNRRLDTLTPAHKALLPLSNRDIAILKQSPLDKWRNVFLHQPEFMGAGMSELGYPQIVVDNKVEAVDREVLMEDFRQLELLLPLTPNE